MHGIKNRFSSYQIAGTLSEMPVDQNLNQEKFVNRFCKIALTWLSAAFCATGALAQTTPHYLIVNNNHP